MATLTIMASSPEIKIVQLIQCMKQLLKIFCCEISLSSMGCKNPVAVPFAGLRRKFHL